MPPKRKFAETNTANKENACVANVEATISKADHALNLPRISEKLSVAAMKGELKARGIQVKGISSLTKVQGLELLRVGSIFLSGTAEYLNFQRIKTLMEKEEAAARVGKTVDEYEVDEARRKQQIAEDRTKQQIEQQSLQRKRETAVQMRQEEKEAQQQLHKTKLPESVHGCLVARTEDMKIRGICRLERAQCEYAGRGRCSGQIMYTCEKCDFDICQGCYSFRAMPEEERRALLEKEEAETRKRREKEQQQLAKEFSELKEKWAEYRRRKQESQRQKDAKKAKDAEPLFKKRNLVLTEAIQAPPAASKDSRKMKPFVVWSCEGETYNRPSKQFDSSFDSLRDANSRALFLFFAKNPWGLSVEEMQSDNHSIDEQIISGALKLHTEPDDSGIWSVGVVPKAASAHMQIRDPRVAEDQWGSFVPVDEDDDDEPPYWYRGQTFDDHAVHSLSGFCF